MSARNASSSDVERGRELVQGHAGRERDLADAGRVATLDDERAVGRLGRREALASSAVRSSSARGDAHEHARAAVSA